MQPWPWIDQPLRFTSHHELPAGQFHGPRRSFRDEAKAAAEFVLALPYRLVSFVGTTLFYACGDLTIALAPFLTLVLLIPAMLVVGLATKLIGLVIAGLAILVARSVARDFQGDQGHRYP